MADITLKEGVFFLSGELNFSNVMSVYVKSLSQLSSMQTFVFDFSALQSSNSVIFALLVEWVKYAKKHQKSIEFKHVPEKIMTITKAARIEKLLEHVPKPL